MSKSRTPRARPKPRKGRSAVRVRTRSGNAATGATDGFGVITVSMRTKSGLVTIRSSGTGRFTAARSAKVIDRGAERFARTLKRLATK